jgi:tetratricopeptide (TPR) repeat protein
MKPLYSVVMALMLLHTASAQESGLVTGLRITERTKEERIDFLMRLAQAYIADDDAAAALDVFDRVLKMEPEQFEVFGVIASIYISEHKYAEAEEILLNQIETDPEAFRPKNNLAWLYATATDPAFRNGRKAIRLAQEALVSEPNSHHVWSTLSEAYYVTGDYEKAYRAIRHMAALAVQQNINISKEAVEDYNAQIRKCKRAMDAQKILSGEDVETL